MKTKKELRKIALKAWRARRFNEKHAQKMDVPDEYVTAAAKAITEENEKRHNAAIKAWKTRRENLQVKRGVIPDSADKGIIEKTEKMLRWPVKSLKPMGNETEIEKHGVECAKILGKMTGVRAFATVFQVGNQIWRLKISRLARMPPSKPAC